MKTILFVSLFVFFGGQFQADPLREAINNSDFVGFLYHDRTSEADETIFKADEVFKGGDYYLIDRNSEINVNDEGLYLVIGNVEDHILLNVNFSVREVADLSKTELDVLQELPCNDDSVKSSYQNLICHRLLDPVCGCDNRTYSNICEMKKQGIVKFKPGKCK